MEEIWELIKPVVFESAIGMLATIAAAVIPAILASGWYAQKKWWEKKIIAIILKFVERNMPIADAIKSNHGGKIPEHMAESLHDEVVNCVMNEVDIFRPELAPVLEKINLDKTISKAVEKVKRQRKGTRHGF